MEMRDVLAAATSDLDTDPGRVEVALDQVLRSPSVNAGTSDGGHPDPGGDIPRSGHERRRVRRAVAAGLVAAACLLVGGLAIAEGQPTEGEVATQHGLVKHTDPGPGEVTAEGITIGGNLIDDPDCQGAEGRFTVIQEVEDGFYCITADTKIEAWIIGQQLLGRTPTEAEIAAMDDALGSDG